MSHDCCKSEEKQKNDPLCPRCGKKGKSVSFETVEHLVKAGGRNRIEKEASYFFCKTEDCDVVYYSAQGGTVFSREDVRVPVWQKDKGLDVPACYCFHHTRRLIYEEIEETGESTVQETIAQLVKEGRCACEITNPQGSCCLGNVNKTIEEGFQIAKKGKR